MTTPPLMQPLSLCRRFLRAAWQPVQLWRFRLFQRHRHDHLVLENIAGKSFVILPQVFNPALFATSQFLAETLNANLIPPDATVLDMGTGSGVAAVFAARWSRRVIAVDVNPAAVRCAQINALLNQVDDRIEIRLGDLFAPVADQRFDVVLFNPPFFRGVPRTPLDQAWRSIDVVERFASNLREHLTARGCALVILSTEGDTHTFLHAFQVNGFAIGAIAQRDLISEALTIYRIW